MAAAPLLPRFALPAPAAGRLCVLDDLLLAAVADPAGRYGIAAYDALSGEAVWITWGVPPLAASDGELIYGYDGATLVALDRDGSHFWSLELPGGRRPGPGAPAPDVVPGAGGVVVAAGATLYLVRDGAVVARAVASEAPAAVVARLAPAAGGVVASCARRGPEGPGPGLPYRPWQPLPLPGALAAEPGELLCFDGELRVRWALPPEAGRVVGARATVAVAGVLVTVAALTRDDGAGPYELQLEAEACARDLASGDVRWRRRLPVGPGFYGPLYLDGLLVCGSAPLALSLDDGATVWGLPAGPRADSRIAPAAACGRVLFFADATLSAVSPHGAVERPLRLALGEHGGRVVAGPLVRDGLLYLGLAEPEQPAALRCYDLHQAWPEDRADP